MNKINYLILSSLMPGILFSNIMKQKETLTVGINTDSNVFLFYYQSIKSTMGSLRGLKQGCFIIGQNETIFIGCHG